MELGSGLLDWNLPKKGVGSGVGRVAVVLFKTNYSKPLAIGPKKNHKAI